ELLLAHAEPLLLVDDDEPEVLEANILLDEAVRADDDVDLAILHVLDRLLLLLLRSQARHHLDIDREGGHPLLEGLEMLQRQDGGRYEDGDLFPGIRGLECGPNRDLGLAEPNVTTDEPVHRARRLHVALHCLDRGKLVRRLLVGERLGQLVVPAGIGRELISGTGVPVCVELDQLERHLAYCTADSSLGLDPVAGAELVERRRGRASRAVASYAIALVDGDVELLALLELQLQVFALDTAGLTANEPDELRDTVIDVDNVLARLQARREGAPLAGGALACPAGLL